MSAAANTPFRFVRVNAMGGERNKAMGERPHERPLIKFEQIVAPPVNVPAAELEIEGARIDLHQMLQFVGLTYGAEERTVTMGFASREDIRLSRDDQIVHMGGLALTMTGVTRFEVSFQERPAGALDFLELRNDPEATILFFFEGGTVRMSGAVLRGEILLEQDESEQDKVIH